MAFSTPGCANTRPLLLLAVFASAPPSASPLPVLLPPGPAPPGLTGGGWMEKALFYCNSRYGEEKALESFIWLTVSLMPSALGQREIL